MIDDEDLGVLSTSSIAIVIAVFVGRAIFPQAIAVVAGNFIPDGASRREGEFGAGAIVSLKFPLSNLFELLEFFVA